MSANDLFFKTKSKNFSYSNNFLKKFTHFIKLQGNSSQQKAATQNANACSSSMTACHVIGKPVWTSRQYESLARAGYIQNVIVFRCVNLIAKSLSNVKFLLYRKIGSNDYEIEYHKFLNLLNTPSKNQAGSAFLEHVFSQLLLSGNAYIKVGFSRDKMPISLNVLRSDRVSVLVNDLGEHVGFEYKNHNKKEVFPINYDVKIENDYNDKIENNSSLILHLKTFNPLNDWYGLSPIEAAARAIDQHNAVGEHNLSILQNGGRPSGALLVKPQSSGQTLTQTQRENLRRDLRTIYEGTENAGRIMVLEGDCEWKEMGLSPKDLDFKSGKNISAREIAQAFGVPPILVGLTEDATFSNYKEARLNLWEDTLLPLIDNLISEFNRTIVPFFGDNLRLGYNQDEIPALSVKRERVWNMMQQASFLTINEKRQAFGYCPINEGNRLEEKLT